MIPRQETHYKDTPFEIHYVDGVMCTREVTPILGEEAARYTLIGSQAKRKHFFKRKSRLKTGVTYYKRYIIMIDLLVHVMIADNPEFDGWEHYTFPIGTRIFHEA